MFHLNSPKRTFVVDNLFGRVFVKSLLSGNTLKLSENKHKNYNMVSLKEEEEEERLALTLDVLAE